MWSDSDGERELHPNEAPMGRTSNCSQVVVIEEGGAASDNIPTISQLNVSNKSTVHVGPKFVAVTQHVQNAEMVQNLSLPCYIWAILKSTSRVERLWCAVALACLALGIAMIVYFTKYAKTDVADADIAPHEWNITREMWLAQPYLTEENSTAFEPLRLVVIQHTVGQECFKFIVCAAELRNLQSWFLKDKKYDIPYNFMIGNDGRVYEGRGWEKVGAHTKFFNRCALGIGFTGDYREEMPRHATVTEQQLNRTNALLEYGVQRGFLHPQYQVLGAKDVSDTVSPGSNLYNAIRKWEHFYDGHHYRNKSCEQVYAEFNDG